MLAPKITVKKHKSSLSLLLIKYFVSVVSYYVLKLLYY